VADSQLAQLAKPFAPHLVHTNPSGGGSYVSHSAVNEKLLAVVGPFSWERVEVIRGHVPGIAANPSASSKRGKEGRPPLENVVVGYIGRLTVRVDGQVVSTEETGDCEDPHNWGHDGQRLKDASSDAFKRCAMRLSVGLHMWSQYQGKSEFFLYDYLMKQEGEMDAPVAAAS
jgi:hypothetical protein